MLFASDDEQPVADGPQRPKRLGLSFLESPCTCQRRVCFQQFRGHQEAVETKRKEFEALQPHEKAGAVKATLMLHVLQRAE